MSFQPFPCDCGGIVSLSRDHDLDWEIRSGITLRVPQSVEVPTCGECRSTFTDPATEKAIAQALRPELARIEGSRLRELVDSIVARHETTIGIVEAACCVTPTYLSHLRSGKRVPSEKLLKLLSIFDTFPSVFEWSSFPILSQRIAAQEMEYQSVIWTWTPDDPTMFERAIEAANEMSVANDYCPLDQVA